MMYDYEMCFNGISKPTKKLETMFRKVHWCRVGNFKNFPDSSIYRAKPFRTGKKCVNPIFATKKGVIHNFVTKGWFNSRFISFSIWKPATRRAKTFQVAMLPRYQPFSVSAQVTHLCAFSPLWVSRCLSRYRD